MLKDVAKALEDLDACKGVVMTGVVSKTVDKASFSDVASRVGVKEGVGFSDGCCSAVEEAEDLIFSLSKDPEAEGTLLWPLLGSLRVKAGLVGPASVGVSVEIDPRVVITDGVLIIIEVCSVFEGARILEVSVLLGVDPMVSDTLV